MTPDSGPDTGRPARPGLDPAALPGAPRQRWRITFRSAARDRADSRRNLVSEWIGRLEESGLPLAPSAGNRSRQAISLGAPLPLGMSGERELADLILTERLPAWRVRSALAGAMPDGCQLTQVADVWLGAAPLPGAITGADYRVRLAPDGDPGAEAVRRAAAAFVAAPAVPRIRQKGGRDIAYDLRPLVAGIAVSAGPPTAVLVRAVIDPERGSGRPEEVLAALSELSGAPIVAAETVRERLRLAGEPDPDLEPGYSDGGRRPELRAGDAAQEPAAVAGVGR